MTRSIYNSHLFTVYKHISNAFYCAYRSMTEKKLLFIKHCNRLDLALILFGILWKCKNAFQKLLNGCIGIIHASASRLIQSLFFYLTCAQHFPLTFSPSFSSHINSLFAFQRVCITIQYSIRCGRMVKDRIKISKWQQKSSQTNGIKECTHDIWHQDD